MSPSRGLLSLLPTTRSLTTLLSNPSNKPLIFLSLSHSPHFNLSLEHYLFTTLPSTTPHLLLYRNTPSLILGRNQNPWLEVNHPYLLCHNADPKKKIDLVRRRSGGGTVYHDLGNVNYSVTTPTSTFSRDKHAQMVVRALRGMGVNYAAVNHRHDIVLTSDLLPPPDRYEEVLKDEADPRLVGSRKVSGSAYKLTREKSYHHGTMLLKTDVERLRREGGGLLKSPVAGRMRARGVASVPSPVENVGVEEEMFCVAVVREWHRMYGDAEVAVVDEEEVREIGSVRKGEEELRSMEWVYGQTPRFELDLPGEGGTVAVDKGVVTECEVFGEVVGRKFGGEVVREILEKVGYEEAEKWARENIGGSFWGEV